MHPESSLEMSECALFVDHVLLPAIQSVYPFHAQNFGASTKADVERLRNDKGHIVYKSSSSVPGARSSALVDKMREIIKGDAQLARFAGFFFDVWATGMKEPLGQQLEPTFPDINFNVVDCSRSFVDVGVEVLPHNKHGLVAGPVSECLSTFLDAVFDNPSSKYHMRSVLKLYHFNSTN